jgi:hypothetical protein
MDGSALALSGEAAVFSNVLVAAVPASGPSGSAMTKDASPVAPSGLQSAVTGYLSLELNAEAQTPLALVEAATLVSQNGDISPSLPYDSARIMATSDGSSSNNWLEPSVASAAMWDDGGWSVTDTLEALAASIGGDKD